MSLIGGDRSRGNDAHGLGPRSKVVLREEEAQLVADFGVPYTDGVDHVEKIFGVHGERMSSREHHPRKGVKISTEVSGKMGGGEARSPVRTFDIPSPASSCCSCVPVSLP